VRCHGTKEGIIRSGHDLDGGCLACHTFLGNQSFLWGLGEGEGQTPSVRRCRFCHAPDSPFQAQAVVEFNHPGGALRVTGAVLYSRLDSGTGEALSCTVCHDPHGQSRAMLRPGRAERLCAPCHGPRGLTRYLHFHR
jgi:predicted CXXCH cytochrome family protein